MGIGSTTKKSSLVLKKMIDKLYSKEIKFVYSNQNNREDCIGQQSVIFDL